MKSYTDIEQSKKLAEILPLESADMFYDGVQDLCKEKTYSIPINGSSITVRTGHIITEKGIKANLLLPAWSLAALLKLIPKHILRKDKIHHGQTFIPSFRWEITPTAIYYTDGNDIMDYASFRYGDGENNIELIDAVFKMVVWLKEKELL